MPDPRANLKLGPMARRREGVTKHLITMPDDLWDRLGELQEGERGRSALIEQAVREYLRVIEQT